MYNGETLTWLDMLIILGFFEAPYAFMYIALPVCSVAFPLLLACRAYERYGSTPQLNAATGYPALDHPCGIYSDSIWERLPELKLLYKITTGHAVYDRLHNDSDVVPVTILTFLTMVFVHKTRETHFPNSGRSMMKFLLYERLVFAFLGLNVITALGALGALGALDMVAHLTVATSIVLTANRRARGRFRNQS
jgi:hypothetical protein